MSDVSVSTSVSIHLEEDEKESLIKAYSILKELRHELFLKDDDSEVYWCIDGAMLGVGDTLSFASVKVEGY